MDETRRGFLKAMMTATVAAFAAAELGDPEALLWTPRKKTIIDLGARPALEVPTVADMAHIFMDPHVGGLVATPFDPIYMPDRFTFRTGTGLEMKFDSDFRPTSMNGKRLTDREKAEMAAEMARSRRTLTGADLWATDSGSRASWQTRKG